MADYLMQFFDTTSLSPDLQWVGGLYKELAMKIVANLSGNPERTEALRKLLESREAALRAAVSK